MNTNCYSIKVDGKQMQVAGAEDTLATLQAVFGITDPTAEIVGEYYGTRGDKLVDVTVEIFE